VIPDRLLFLAACQRFVDQSLIAAAVLCVNLLSKPIQDVGVEANGDAGFVRWDGMIAPCRAWKKS